MHKCLETYNTFINSSLNHAFHLQYVNSCIWLYLSLLQYEALDDSERRPSRKQKSLGLLCQKFLALYPDYPETSESIHISLDEVATHLGKRQ